MTITKLLCSPFLAKEENELVNVIFLFKQFKTSHRQHFNGCLADSGSGFR